jgi:glutamate-1-semialdehyde 2,1-aminomutase
VGGVYQAGTLSGNPLAVSGGVAALNILKKENPYPELERKAGILESGIRSILTKKGIPHTINRVGSMLSLFFNSGPVHSYEDALLSNKQAFIDFFGKMLDQGIYLAPSPFEAWFLGMAHSEEDVSATLAAAEKSL